MIKAIDWYCDKALPWVYAGLVLLHTFKGSIGWATAVFFIYYTLISRRPA